MRQSSYYAVIVWTVIACLANVLVDRSTASEAISISAVNYSRQQIYHSPQSPGWTSWVGAWIMPNGDLMVGATQAKGPLLPEHVKRSYRGLDVSVIYLRGTRDTDGGGNVKWTKVAESGVKFTTPQDSGKGTHANNSPTTIALTDGSLIRRVYGWDYQDFTHLPGTAFMQRSTDGGHTWSSPPTTMDNGKTWSETAPIQNFLLDPVYFTVQPTRIRRIGDGRLMITGGVWNGAHTQSATYEPLMMVSSDEGTSWQRIIFSGSGWRSKFNIKLSEWDVAELGNGNLLMIARPFDNTARWQGLMTKSGKSWEVQSFAQTAIPHSGHPELLKTHEGPVLHIARTGTLWTKDAGVNWNPLRFDSLPSRPGGDYRSLYYPVSVQTSDGWIYVFSHRGWDNYYGQVDQAVFMDRFKLIVGGGLK